MKIQYLILFLLCNWISGQNSTSFEDFYSQKAIAAKDQGDYNAAIEHYYKILDQYPDKEDYLYEIAMCYYRQENYSKAIELGERLISNNPNVFKYYRLLGNSYDLSGDSSTSISILLRGCEKFPTEGDLYLDLGIIQMIKYNYDSALEYWESGIRAEPTLSDNYYWAATTYLKTNEKFWAFFYGEIFLNMEKGTARFNEVSKSLYQGYIDEIYNNGGNYEIYLARPDNNKVKRAWTITKELMIKNGLYNPTVGLNFDGKPRYMEAIDFVRKNFVDLWMQMYGHELNIDIIKRHAYIIQAGYSDSYTHWLFINGNPDYFLQWQQLNYNKYMDFIEWFVGNTYSPSPSNYFSRLDFFD